MPASAPRALPEKPSLENLRKQAKKLAKASGLKLAAAQRQLAGEYGYPSWAALIRAVEALSPPQPLPPLTEAALRGDEAAVRARLPSDATPEGRNELATALWRLCADEGPVDRRLAIARILVEAGASSRQGDGKGVTALHHAARLGSRELVELLITHGGRTWQGDSKDRKALDYAKKGSAPDRDAILDLLEQPRLRGPFRDAVDAIHAGNIAKLRAVLDANPDLIREHAQQPECFNRDYFYNPAVVWFIANNPILVKTQPDNIVDVAELIIARGPAKADIDYALGLVMTGMDEKMAGRQFDLVQALIRGGATLKPEALASALGERATGLVEKLLAAGAPMTAAVAAGTGRADDLRRLLPSAAEHERRVAFALAVAHRHLETARICLDAGIGPNGFMAMHQHSSALHQAAINNDVPMLRLLLEFGADLSVRDTMWDGTPLGWAKHENKREAAAFLQDANKPT